LLCSLFALPPSLLFALSPPLPSAENKTVISKYCIKSLAIKIDHCTGVLLERVLVLPNEKFQVSFNNIMEPPPHE